MTVKKLIAFLQEQNPNKRVYIEKINDNGDWIPMNEPTIELDKDGNVIIS